MPDLLCGGDPHKSEGTAGRWLHVPYTRPPDFHFPPSFSLFLPH
jgi:hypothetical protein